MMHALQWLRSLLFIVQMYVAMAVLAIVYTPFAIFSRPAAYAAMHAYCRWVRWTAAWMVGLRSEVRGTPPTDEVLVAAKHHSFFDIIILFGSMPRAKFIMKKELKWAPILGWYALRIGCVPVDRGKRGQAIAAMMKAVEAGAAGAGAAHHLPRRAPASRPARRPPYKVGSAVLYSQLGQDCVPAATNVGVFWPRHGITRKPGLAVVEFLPRIAPGLTNAEFMAELEARIEGATNRLLAEAGFHGRPTRLTWPPRPTPSPSSAEQAGRGRRRSRPARCSASMPLYLDGKVVALVCDDSLFVKPTSGALALLGDPAMGPPYPGAKPHIAADALLDEPDRLVEADPRRGAGLACAEAAEGRRRHRG